MIYKLIILKKKNMTIILKRFGKKSRTTDLDNNCISYTFI